MTGGVWLRTFCATRNPASKLIQKSGLLDKGRFGGAAD